MLIGGVLSAVLSIAADIHTEYYLEKRLILIAIVFVFRQIILRFMVSSDMFYIVLFLILAGISYIVLFTKIRDVNTDWGEMTVILLSDPELYWTISDTLMFAIWKYFDNIPNLTQAKQLRWGFSCYINQIYC